MIKPFQCELLTWEDMYEYSRVLAGKIRDEKFRPNVLVAMARGGYVPARSLCDFLMVDDLLSLKVEHWRLTARRDEHARLSRPLPASHVCGKNVLLVDDLAHTGESFKVAVAHIRSLKPKSLKTAALFVMEGSPFTPDFYVAKKTVHWVIFPWNFMEDVSHLVAGLFDVTRPEKKSLEMLAEELRAKHGFTLSREKLKHVMDELVIRKVLSPCWVSGHLMRWMPFIRKRR